jgi:hypothetical protein
MHVGEILEPEKLVDVPYVCRKADLGCEAGPAVTLSGESRTVHDMPTLPEADADVAPAPASVHGTVHKDERGHLDSSPPGRTGDPILPVTQGLMLLERVPLYGGA